MTEYVRGDEDPWERGPMEGLAKDGQLMGYRHPGFWSCMDTFKEKTMLEEQWNSGKAPWCIWDDVDQVPLLANVVTGS